MVEAYSLDQLRVEGINIGSIVDLQFCNKPGTHAELFIKAEIYEETETDLLFESISHQIITLYAEKSIIFKGILCELIVEKQDGIGYAMLLIKSYSILMDIKKKSRTFQDITITYGNLISQMLSEYPGADCQIYFSDIPIGKLLVQYKESDWEFINRIMSELYIPIANAVSYGNIRLFFGVPLIDMNCTYNIIGMSKNEDEVKKAQKFGALDNDFVDYEFVTGTCLSLFSTVLIERNKVVVREVNYELRKGLLKCKCIARVASGILVHPTYPIELVGIAIEGRILEVKGNLVRVHMNIDDGYVSSDSYWFPYATLSASQDGSGWYYMPEVGDRVRIQFPTKYASDAIVISSVGGYGVPQNGEDSMKDPSTKYLSNSSGQRLGMGENGINVSTRSGSATVSLSNSGAVSMMAMGNIAISAKDAITLKSEGINIHALEKINIICEQGGGVELMDDGNIQLSGGEITIN